VWSRNGVTSSVISGPLAMMPMGEGKFELTSSSQCAVQSLGRAAVVIHDLARLNGHYTSGEQAQIAYVDGRGQDRRKDQQINKPGLAR
jgi:hypothetical protein